MQTERSQNIDAKRPNRFRQDIGAALPRSWQGHMPQHITACPALTWELRSPARLHQQTEGNREGGGGLQILVLPSSLGLSGRITGQISIKIPTFKAGVGLKARTFPSLNAARTQKETIIFKK